MFKTKFKKAIVKIDYKDLNNFYNMLLKYKNRNPNFNIDRVITMLYPNLDWSRVN
jgi:hypothetical protein